MLTCLFLSFVSAFVGPTLNPGEMVPLERKFAALDTVGRTGDARPCDKILAAIRNKRVELEHMAEGLPQAIKDVEAGIQLEEMNLREAPARYQPLTQGTIDSLKRALVTWRTQQANLERMIAGRVQEEAAFSAVYQAIKLSRAAQEAP